MNQSQKRAIQREEGPCLVLAGPGSGKTLTIVNRIKFLIEEKRVRPEEILVVTFTRYAAAEMKKRLCKQMGRETIPVTAGTFHGIYYGILKCTYHFSPGNILSEAQKCQILRAILNCQKIEIFDEEDFIQEIAAGIGAIKNADEKCEISDLIKCDTEIFQKFYHEYEEQKKALEKIDFDDILLMCRDLFLSRPDILKKWQDKFTHILIDEFQDINRVQYEVIKMLALPQNNLFVVGDDDQAIYSFRGADSRLMYQFLKDFPQAGREQLAVNYRSTANIVKNSMRVIANNKTRFQKQLHTVKEDGANVHVQEVEEPLEESRYIVKEIRCRMAEGVPPEEIAVLFRLHTDARAIVESLVEHQVPFYMRERLPNVYAHFIGRDIQAYFRIAQGDGMRRDFLQILNRPKRYLSREALSQEEVSFEGLRKYYFDKQWMQERIQQFEQDVKMLAKMAPYAAVRFIRKKIGYDDFLREYAEDRGKKVSEFFEILEEIEESAKPYVNYSEWFRHVEEYTAALQEKAQQKKEEQAGIRLMTIHGAKGLEFDTVFLIGANEGSVPYKKAKNSVQIEEERRLFYVAMTRAKEILKISYVKQKNGKSISPSRFVQELLQGI